MVNASGFQSLGFTGVTGCVSTDLPLAVGNRTFRISYGGLNLNKVQNTLINPLVLFRTTAVTLRLLDSTGTNGIPGALIQYNAGGFRTLGTTDTTGTVTAELLGVNTTFRVTHAGQTLNKTQNTGTNPNVIFQTGRVLQGTGPRILAWWASGWQTFTNGVELLPGNVNFDFDTGPNQVHTVVAGTTIYVPFAPTAPVVTAADQSANEGEAVPLSLAAFIDQEVTQTHRATVDWGDGSALEAGVVSQTDGLAGTVTGNHVFTDDGSYTVEVCVSDDGNPDAEGCDTLELTVANLAPQVTILGAPGTGEEGTEVTLSSLVDDVDPVTMSWSVTLGDNQVVIGGDPKLSFTPVDEDVYDVSLTVDDGEGGVTTTTGQVTVVNVAPVVTITGTSDPVGEDETVTLGSIVSDPGTTDLLTHSWTATLDAVAVATGTDGEFSFTADMAGFYVVTLVVNDGDGGSTSTQAVIEVTAIPTPEPEPIEEPEPNEKPTPTVSKGTDRTTAQQQGWSWSQDHPGSIETQEADPQSAPEPESETTDDDIRPTVRADQVMLQALIAEPPAGPIGNAISTAVILSMLWVGPCLFILARRRLSQTD